MPLGKKLRKARNKVVKETQRVVDQVTDAVKEIRNEFSNDVAFYKEKLSAIGIGYDDEYANLKVPSSGENTQPFKWNWLTSTTGSNSDQVYAFKKIIEILEAKNNPDLYQKLLSELNANTKNALDANIKEYNITVPTLQTEDQKVALPEDSNTVPTPQSNAQEVAPSEDNNTVSTSQTNDQKIAPSEDSNTVPTLQISNQKVKLINGKEVEIKKFLELLYNQDTKELDYLLKMLPSETSETIKKEVTLKLAFDYYKDNKSLNETNNIAERIGTGDIFEEYLVFNLDQLSNTEAAIMGGIEYSYLDINPT